MNKREFLKFLPVSAAAVAIPTASFANVAPHCTKKISAVINTSPVIESGPVPIMTVGYSGNIGIGTNTPRSLLSLHTANARMDTAYFEQRSDGHYNLVFKHEKNS